MKNTLDELRTMATKLLDASRSEVNLNIFGNNIKRLLEELSIYQIELEHQNNALEASEHELAASRAEYIEIFESAPMGYVILDHECKIIKANKTFISLYVSMKDMDRTLDGRNFSEFIHPAFQNAFYLFCKMLQKNSIPMPLEIRMLDKNGTPKYVLITAAVNVADTPQYRLSINDLTMQKKLEAQLPQARDKAEAEDRQKSLFLTNVSHEIRTPLATITGFGALLKDKRLDQATRDGYIDSMIMASDMLMSLSDDVLNLSVLESGSMPINCSNTHIAAICNETATLIQRKLRDKNVLFTTDVDAMPVLWTAPLRIRQIVLTVLEHAAGNATEGSVIVHAKFAKDEHDSSKGILLLRFTGKEVFSGETSLQLETHSKTTTKNCAGLGIFMAKRIAKAMHGQLQWEHPLDSLVIEIPVRISEHPDPEPAPVIASENFSDPPQTCLLVDDVVLNLKVLAAMMKKLNFIPSLATSAHEALELLAKKHFDIIMTDLWMPEMNGEEFALMVRQDSKCDDTPIFAVTADVERNTNFNMDFFADTIIKPVSIEKIRTTLYTLHTDK